MRLLVKVPVSRLTCTASSAILTKAINPLTTGAYASTREDGHDNSAGRDDDLCAFCSTLPGRGHKLFDNFCAYRFVFKCLVQHLAALYLHLIDRDQPTR